MVAGHKGRSSEPDVAQDIVRPSWKLEGSSEMNAHIPQSYEATAELQEIAAVPHQIIRPRDSNPVIGVVQDALAGSYLCTRPGNQFTRREFMNMMMKNKRFEKVPEPRVTDPETGAPRFTGQQIVGTLFAPINMEMNNSMYRDKKVDYNKVIIREGVFEQGILDKGIFNKSGHGILHTTYNDYGPKAAVELLDGIQNMMESYLIMKGFSVGISDLIADESTRKQMEDAITRSKQAIDELTLSVHTDLFTNNSGKSNQEEFEAKANAILTKALSEAGKIGVKSLSDENRLMTMIRSGSKGDENNVAQMIACLGQVSVEGKRIPYGFTDRTLPHYKMFDDGAEARGFVESSFVRGLNPQEFFFHAMAGREGLIDTAVKTAETGYTQRQLIKAMENLTTQHDGTVRDGMGKIVQFRYGEDGISSVKLEGIDLPLEKLTDKQIKEDFGLQGVDFSTILTPTASRGEDEEAIAEFVDQIFKDRKMLVEGVFASGRPFPLTVPLNLERMITNIRIKFGLKKDQPTDLTPLKVLQDIDTLCERTQSFNQIWTSALRFHLAPHKMVVKERFTVDAWNMLVETIVSKNWKSWATPGELVGIVAAQSIGEPATQMSALSSTVISLTNGKNMFYYGPVKDFIDPLLEKHKSTVVDLGDNSSVLPMEEDYYIVGVSNNEKTSWKRISEISRHPANGGMVEVHTRSGRKTTATLSHSFLKRSEAGIVPVLGSDLKVGMRIPVARIVPEAPNALKQIQQGETNFVMDKEFGWVCGIYLADGSFSGNTTKISKIHPRVEEKLRTFASKYNISVSVRNHQGAYGPSKDTILESKDLKDFLLNTFKTGSYEKEIGPMIFHSNKEFIAGLIGGFFDGDGNVSADRQLIRASSRSQKLIEQVASLLGFCGLFGTVSQETSIRMEDKIQHTLCILRKQAEQFKAEIGFELKEKADALDDIIKYMRRSGKHSQQEFIDKIPELGRLLAETGKLLQMPGQSRTYGRWLKKESIGRQTLENYVAHFEEKIAEGVEPAIQQQIQTNLALLKSALDADVIWDEITELVYLDDPKEYVYDFTVPGNDSFMVDNNILVHNTLNTFHQAGVASKSAMTRGVPRLKELLKVTKNPKATSITIALKPAFRNDRDMVRMVSQDLELTLLKDIVSKAAIYYDPVDDNTILPEDRDMISFFKEMEITRRSGSCKTDGSSPSEEDEEKGDEESYSKWILRFEFDREKMFNKNITMDDVYFVIQNCYAFHNDQDNMVNTIYSDYNSQKLVMRIRPKASKFMYGDDLAGIKKFLSVLLQNTIIRGMAGVRAVTWRKDTNRVEFDAAEGAYKEVSQYLLDTDGSNFISILAHPAVDGDTLYSTNVHDVYDQLGIEATRAALYSEIKGLFEDAGGVNYRHLGLLCDVMTHGGKPMSVDRYGINKMDSGPLAKACFEETEKVLKTAAIFGEMDPVTGVSANIMMGQPIRAGTAYSQVLLDEEALVRMLQGLPVAEEEEEEEMDEKNFEAMVDQELYGEDADACARLETQMNMVLPKPNAVTTEEEEIELVEL
jgi:DNA-directed RNA polymerase beta' subunit